MKPADLHIHPRNESMGVYGYELEVGDVLEDTDLYDSSMGCWEPAPVPGLPIGEGNDAIWIRPTVPRSTRDFVGSLSV
jgi:hypothetical protein